MPCTSQPACFFPLSRLFFCSFLSQYIFQARPQMSHGLCTRHVVQRPGISAWLVCYGTHYCGLFWPLFFTAILLPWQLNFDPTSFTHRDVVKFRFSEKATKVWEKNLIIFWHCLIKSDKWEIFFKFLWPSQYIWTLNVCHSISPL